MAKIRGGPQREQHVEGNEVFSAGAGIPISVAALNPARGKSCWLFSGTRLSEGLLLVKVHLHVVHPLSAYLY